MQPRNPNGLHKFILTVRNLIVYGVEFKGKRRISVKFERKVESWPRYVSQLYRDKVILDLVNAKKFLNLHGDSIAYRVYNLWRSIPRYIEKLEAFGIKCDLTSLRAGVLSAKKQGELFSTYGHLHKKQRGEAYRVLANSCYLVLTHKKSLKTYLVRLKEGDTIFIQPDFLHRLTSNGKEDCLVITFAPKDIGHDYGRVKGRGFPFHLFLFEADLKIGINPKYRKHVLEFVLSYKSRVDALHLFEHNTENMREILMKPNRHKGFYFP